jgi:multiple sugar transport system substrate-binding protein
MKKFTLFLVIGLLLLSVSSVLSQEEVTLQVTSWSAEQQEFYEEAVAEFEAEYPEINVEWETLEQSAYRESMPLRFQSGDAPDIFFWLGANRVLTMAELLDQDWIGPLAPEGTDTSEWMERWPEGSFAEGINLVDGTPYSFPFNDNKIWGAGYMYMNTDVWEAAGLDVNDPPQTRSELLEACRTIVEETGVFCMAVPLDGNQLQRTWYPLAGMAMSDQFFDIQTGRYAIDDPRLLDTFEYIQTFFEEDLVVPGFNDQTFSRGAFANGQAAVYFDGAWMPSVFRNSYDFENVAAAAPPIPDEGRTGSLAQTYSENKFYVSSQTEYPEEAWLFIEFMTRPDGFFAREYLARGFGTLAYADNAEYIEDPVFQDVIEIANEQDIRVLFPEPVVECPDLVTSEALIEAENIRRNWEFEEMSLALSEGNDFADTAQEIAAEKNRVFLETLEEEGFDPACYAFPDFNFTEAFDTANYDN